MLMNMNHPTDSRAKALQQLMVSMRRALVERRQVIEIGVFKFRFQRRNEDFEDGDYVYQALQSGVFTFFSASMGGEEAPGRWLHLGSTDDLEDLMAPHLRQMSVGELEELRVSISAHAVLQSMADDRVAARRGLPPSLLALPTSESSADFTRPMQVSPEVAARSYARNALDAADAATTTPAPFQRRPQP